MNETIGIAFLIDHGKSFAKSGDTATNFMAVDGQMSIVTYFSQCELFAQLEIFVGFLLIFVRKMLCYWQCVRVVNRK